MGAITHVDLKEVPVTGDIEGGDTYEMLAEHTIQILKLVRQTMESYLDSLSAAEKTRAEHAIKQMNDYIKQLEKQRKTSGLQKFLKALGPIGLVIAALAGGTLMGVLGALIAIPIAASALLIIREVWMPKQELS